MRGMSYFLPRYKPQRSAIEHRDFFRMTQEKVLTELVKAFLQSPVNLHPSLEAGGFKVCSHSDELTQCILEIRNMNLPVQRQHVQQKPKAVIQPHLATFKASAGWLDKFLSRHSLTLCRQRSIQEKLPAQGRQDSYRSCRHQSYVGTTPIPKGSSCQHGWTPVCFDTATNKTISKKGLREVIVCSNGVHKHCFMVTLTCTVSAIHELQDEDTAHLEKHQSLRMRCIMTIQLKGWMDHQLMMTWNKKVLVKHTKGRHALLVFDTFKVHLKDDVLEENNIRSTCTQVWVRSFCDFRKHRSRVQWRGFRIAFYWLLHKYVAIYTNKVT